MQKVLDKRYQRARQCAELAQRQLVTSGFDWTSGNQQWIP